MDKQTLVRRREDFEEKFDDSKLGAWEEKWKEFLEKYPRDKLSNLEIDDYVEGKRKESFCWWLEHGTRKLGSMWGGSAEKFGIYYKKEQGRYWFDKSRFRDEKEAFSKVKEDILKLLDFAERGEFGKIDREIDTIWPVTKSKIISMYFPGKIVNVHSSGYIKETSEKLGVEYTTPIKTSAEILTELKNSGVFDDWKEKLTAFQFNQKLGSFVWKKVLKEKEPVEETRPEPTIAIQPLNLQRDLIKTKLKLAPDILDQVCANLNAGSHVIVTGPVGTGKTSLADDICQAATDKNFCNGYVPTTATSDWTTFDTIGGYMPIEGGRLRFEEGKFLEAIRANKWLVIDEINRADIDKAFGQLFTVLSGQRVELPFKHSNEKGISIETTNEKKSYFDEENATYKVGRSWRIIATMNVYDMNFLFEMSYAFMRRFAFVYLDVPEPEEFRKLIAEWCGEKGISDETKEKLEKLTELKERKIGPAIIKDMIGYIRHRGEGEIQLAEATVGYILPQLEGMEKEKIENAWKYIGNIFDENDIPNKVIRPILIEMTGLELKEITE